jgi:hypothetical protein
VHRALGAHDGDLRGRPGVVHVGADLLGGHDVEGDAIGLAGDEGGERHRALRIGEQQFRPMLDQSAIFLRRARQKARHVDEGDDRDIEGITEADKARRRASASMMPAARASGRVSRRSRAIPMYSAATSLRRA